MKKLTAIVCVVLCAMTVFAKAKDKGEIVVVNMTELVQKYSGTQSSENILKEQIEEFEEEKDEMMKKLEEKQMSLQDFAKAAESDALSDEESAKQKREFEGKVVEFRQYRQDIMERLKLRQQQIGDEKKRLQKRIFDELSTVVREYSEKQGYRMVIDVTALIYSKNDIDITDEILKIMEKKDKGKD